MAVQRPAFAPRPAQRVPVLGLCSSSALSMVFRTAVCWVLGRVSIRSSRRKIFRLGFLEREPFPCLGGINRSSVVTGSFWCENLDDTAGEFDASIQSPCGDTEFDELLWLPAAEFLISPPVPNRNLQLFVLRTIRDALVSAMLIENLANMHSQGSNVRIPTLILFKSECWSQGLGGDSAAYTLQITYQIEDQHGNAMSGAALLGGVAVAESFSNYTGNLAVQPGPPWEYGTENGIQSNGTFVDNLSAGGLPPTFTRSGGFFQEFNSGGIIGGVPFFQPMMIEGLGPTTSILNDVLGPNNVTTNGIGVGTNPETMCPN